MRCERSGSKLSQTSNHHQIQEMQPSSSISKRDIYVLQLSLLRKRNEVLPYILIPGITLAKMSKLGRQDGYLSVNPTPPNQNKPLKNSRLRQESQDDNDATALFQHSPESNKLEREYEAGCLPDEVYDRTLPGWRAGLRRFLTRCLKVESEYLATMQVIRRRFCAFHDIGS